MSETAIVAVYPNEKSEVVEEMKNGFGSKGLFYTVSYCRIFCFRNLIFL